MNANLKGVYLAAASIAAALAVLCIASATAAAGPVDVRGGIFQCQYTAKYGYWAPISAGPNTWIIGNCLTGTYLSRTYRDVPSQQNGPYAGGYIFGNFGGCGAVQMENLGPVSNADYLTISCRPTGTSPTDAVQANGKRDPSQFISIIDCLDVCAWDTNKSGDTGTTVAKDCPAYANVRPWSQTTTGLDYTGQITAAAHPNPGNVAWRYVTRDYKWVMIHDYKHTQYTPAYVFVPGGCVTSPNAVYATTP